MVGGHHLFGGSSNTTCPLPKDEADLLIKGVPVAGSLTCQHLLFIISIACFGVTAIISFILIMKHLHRYTVPKEQRQIIRMVFTPVVFSFFSAISILDYNISIYLLPLPDLYEAFGLVALFLLFIEYVSPDPLTRDVFFANLENRKNKGSMFSRSKEYDIVPGGSLRWYKLKWVILFSYLFVTIIMFIVKEAAQGAGTYCATSFKVRFAHFWVTIIGNAALVFAAISILVYYGRMKKVPEFSRHKPGLKLISFKLIIWVNFIQNLVFNILTGTRAIHGSPKMTGLDLTFGLPATLIAVEQIFFAAFFHYAFRSREYHERNLDASRMGLFRAAAHAFNPFDYIMGMATAVKMLMGGLGPKEDATYVQDPYPRGSDTTLQPGQNEIASDKPMEYSNTYDGPTAPQTEAFPARQAAYRPPPEYPSNDDGHHHHHHHSRVSRGFE